MYFFVFFSPLVWDVLDVDTTFLVIILQMYSDENFTSLLEITKRK